MKKSKLIFTNKYSNNDTFRFIEYNFNPMNRFRYFTGMVIKIRRDEN